MMRKAPASSMQKTYDECYLICSTAIYFEGQNNEPEALRAWQNALDQIYYHNAYKMPSSYVPRSETEKALQDSLRAMELQCKERVDLLQALRKSRKEAEEEAKASGSDLPSNKSRESVASVHPSSSTNGHAITATWLGNDTVPQATYADIPKPPGLPERQRPSFTPSRPSYKTQKSSGNDVPRSKSFQTPQSPSTLSPPPTDKSRARTPSPEKKSGGMLRTLRMNPKDKSSAKSTNPRNRPLPAAAKAATQVWSGQQRPSGSSNGSTHPPGSSHGPSNANTTTSWDPFTRSLVEKPTVRDSVLQQDNRRASDIIRPPSASDYNRPNRSSFDDMQRSKNQLPPYPDYPVLNPHVQHSDDSDDMYRRAAPVPPPHRTPPPPQVERSRPHATTVAPVGSTSMSYRKEFPNHPNVKVKSAPPPVPGKSSDRISDSESSSKEALDKSGASKQPPVVPRKAVRAAGLVSAIAERQKLDNTQAQLNHRMKTDLVQAREKRTGAMAPPTTHARPPSKPTVKREIENKPIPVQAIPQPPNPTSDSSDSDAGLDQNDTPNDRQEWDARVKAMLKNLPKGVDETAAKQIFNEIVIQGDEVHWDDVAGLEIAKSALKETVVYPFLRPDLFMGLREPARGMLLFGPPGTGKTMLARAVATESKSVFFAISASSLTSKFLGESEKLVRALFALAKELAPSIIFVDEIDSLLSARGGSSEHEATRRIKTEFLIQWSDLQKAAAGREPTSDSADASRVLVLAATNLPWAIDEAARRRFVRRQYIPLPEDWVREKQLRTLLSAQKHSLHDRDLKMLVRLTDGFSGSDITALAKDAAMGPLRSLGERLLHMSPEEIRPIQFQDFQASLVNIRPSVSKQGLKEFEDWAREFGERGG